MQTQTKPGIGAKTITRVWLACFLALFAGTLAAAELQSLTWDEAAAAPTLQVKLDGKAQFTTKALEKGLRLRVTLAQTTLAKNVTDLGGRDKVKGVFPYLSDDGKAVHIDFLMLEPGRLVVEPAATGYRIVAGAGPAAPADKVAAAPKEAAPTAAPAAKAAATEAKKPAADKKPANAKAAEKAKPEDKAKPEKNGATGTKSANVIQEVTHTRLSGNKVQIKLKLAQPPEEPGTFSIAKPARLALDFFNTRSGLKTPSVRIGEGAVESLTAVQADDRTRVVLNLIKPVGYETRIEGNYLVLTLDNPEVEVADAVRAKTTQFAKADKAGKHNLKNIDFRRGPQGDGKIIVSLSDTNVGINIREEAGEIIVDFVDTNVVDELVRRLDVIDFATPVQTIDTTRQGKNTRMVIKPSGNYEHLAYQAGETFTINVKPVLTKADKKADEFGYTGEKLSLNFQNIEVRAALQVIADFTGMNFVTSDTVRGSLTLRLKDVPWDQALDIIMNAKGLAKRQKGNVVWVAPAEEIAAKEKAQLEATKQVRELEPLVSELIAINYAKAADIAKLLKSIKAVDSGAAQSLFGSVSISKVETESNTLLSSRGQVTVDERTNSLLVQDTASKIREVRKLIAELDRPVRQVLIETRIVEANDDFGKSIGARFGVSNANKNMKIGNSGTVAGDAFLTGKLEGAPSYYNDGEWFVNEQGLNVNLPSPGLGNDLAGSLALTIFKASTGHLINLELSALEAEGKGKIIANPRLITANQKQAHIEQGQERIFTTTVLGVGSVVTKKAVLGLTVTPQITPDERVVLDVLITKDSFVSPTDPTINTKQITTQVLLDNGETVVIGGIFQQDETNNVSKVPLLGDLPLVGALFRKKSSTDNKSELLIFLTPRILSPSLNLSAG